NGQLVAGGGDDGFGAAGSTFTGTYNYTNEVDTTQTYGETGTITTPFATPGPLYITVYGGGAAVSSDIPRATDLGTFNPIETAHTINDCHVVATFAQAGVAAGGFGGGDAEGFGFGFAAQGAAINGGYIFDSTSEGRMNRQEAGTFSTYPNVGATVSAIATSDGP